MSKAVYPGSFNPVHLGHMHVILQASRLFDEVRVLIAVNPEKVNTSVRNVAKELGLVA